jgi:lysophospholipase L1-like esterase
MSSPVKKYTVYAALGLSLLLNVALVGSLANSGGLRRIFLRMDLVSLPPIRQDFQKDLEDRYRKFPNTPAEIVFAGDSLIGDGYWAEYYSEIHNRGIGGETVQGMLGRIDEILESKPRKIFLLLGTNDFAMDVPLAQYLRNYRALLERIRKDSPETTVHVIGILPINTTFPTVPAQTNAELAEANEQLKKLVAEFPGVKFLDLSPGLVDQKGELRREFSKDGLHLNSDGYLAIREPLARFVAEDEARKVTDSKAQHP